MRSSLTGGFLGTSAIGGVIGVSLSDVVVLTHWIVLKMV
jgi:hypothetical protein